MIAEKPYISEKDGKFTLNVPRVEKDKVGATKDYQNADQIDFSNVFVANEKTTAEEISKKINEEGLDVVLQPGIYHLYDTIHVERENAVILGIGMATLICENGPCIEVGNYDGVRVAGILFEAGEVSSPALLSWGQQGFQGNESNPGVASDIFARVGGPNNVDDYEERAESMMTVNSGNVVIDNTWFWRADHDVNGDVKFSKNPVDHGLVVNGDNVKAYGLKSEHTLKDLVQWNGENGLTIMYQSELPYDVDVDFGENGYAGYRVSPTVNSHQGFGIGVYSFFRDHDVSTPSAIVAPEGEGIQFHHSLSVYLWGAEHANIQHIINGEGGTTSRDTRVKYLCQYPVQSEETAFLQ